MIRENRTSDEEGAEVFRVAPARAYVGGVVIAEAADPVRLYEALVQRGVISESSVDRMANKPVVDAVIAVVHNPKP
jgi:hypothetical protein